MNILKNISLKEMNSFQIDIKSKLFVAISNNSDIKNLLISDEFTNNQHLILGEGSNILFTKDFNGIIIKNNIVGKDIIFENKTHTIIKVGAGENWHAFVLWAIQNNLSGIENMALIPGNVGSAPIQNIGAYGMEIKNVIDKVWAINLETRKEIVFENKDCLFKYRSSIFKTSLKNKVIITHVSIKLSKQHKYNTKYGEIEKEIKTMGNIISISNIAQAVINIRKRKLPDPKIIGNSGSFFKNPIISKDKLLHLKKKYPKIISYKTEKLSYKIAAGWLIENCGWKGFREKDYGVHKKQALVIVNYGKANGHEILDLSKKIQKSVKNKFDIELVPEVNII